ncbi:MAG: hypothetical protein QF464_20955, partial [Myxococcota bacterium]|nr:hypothetical protein [Myxococcota bacterium]
MASPGGSRVSRALEVLGGPIGLVLVVAVVALAVSQLWLYRFVSVDDAYITFRYAQNLANFDGLVFNIGDRVEGTS